MTGFDGFSPITDVVADITPTVGSMIADMSVGTNNAATITDLTPFTSHTFSVAVRNAVGLSDRVEVTASTLSLGKFLRAIDSGGIDTGWNILSLLRRGHLPIL